MTKAPAEPPFPKRALREKQCQISCKNRFLPRSGELLKQKSSAVISAKWLMPKAQYDPSLPFLYGKAMLCLGKSIPQNAVNSLAKAILTASLHTNKQPRFPQCNAGSAAVIHIIYSLYQPLAEALTERGEGAISPARVSTILVSTGPISSYISVAQSITARIWLPYCGSSTAAIVVIPMATPA